MVAQQKWGQQVVWQVRVCLVIITVGRVWGKHTINTAFMIHKHGVQHSKHGVYAYLRSGVMNHQLTIIYHCFVCGKYQPTASNH